MMTDDRTNDAGEQPAEGPGRLDDELVAELVERPAARGWAWSAPKDCWLS